MIYALMHVDDPPREIYDWRTTDPDLDVSILVPGADKLCTVVPIAGLRLFLPLLREAMDGRDLEPLRCECCGEILDVPIVERPDGPFDLGDTPFQLGEAIARELAEE